MPAPILVLNCGSSSVKYQVIDAESEAVAASGLIERIGLPNGQVTHKTPERSEQFEAQVPDHGEALRLVVQCLTDFGPGLDGIIAVGHRAVHGGDRFRAPTLIDDAVIQGLSDLAVLAPLHNPPGLAGIQAARADLPGVPHVAVFDTAFFADLPPEAYTYAIDKQIAQAYSIRKYGFHGTSHGYVAAK
ncbi:MAG: acetate kinase, partial [Propionibacteriaceae bacterium]|nr:acetate kinase [Propionibacteriaceae bacterium]